MAAGDAGPINRWQQRASAPNCKACLRILDRLFPAPQADGRIAVVARLVADAVVEYGSAEVVGVPGDQLESLRRMARRTLRDNGFASNTLVQEDRLLVFSDEAFSALGDDVRAQRDLQAASIVSELVAGGNRAERERPWLIRWDAWSTS